MPSLGAAFRAILLLFLIGLFRGRLDEARQPSPSQPPRLPDIESWRPGWAPQASAAAPLHRAAPGGRPGDPRSTAGPNTVCVRVPPFGAQGLAQGGSAPFGPAARASSPTFGQPGLRCSTPPRRLIRPPPMLTAPSAGPIAAAAVARAAAAFAPRMVPAPPRS